MTPIRIQRKRTKGWKMPPNTVYVGRPTKWGNPYKVGQRINPNSEPLTLKRVIVFYRAHLQSISSFWEAKQELKGKNLACWCPLDKPCHANFLLKTVNNTK